MCNNVDKTKILMILMTKLDLQGMNYHIFLPPALKMCNNVDKTKILMILMTKLDLQGMNYHFCGFYRCVNSQT